MGTLAPLSRSLRYLTGGDRTAPERHLHLASALRLARTAEGRSLATLSRESPLLVVFLRHLGCPFTREALADLSVQRRAVEASGARLVLVHLSTDPRALALFSRFGLGDALRVADPQGAIYDAFGLGRGGPVARFGPRVVWRAVRALLSGRAGLGLVAGDPLRLPGAFLVHEGAIVRAYRPSDASGRPDYAALARHRFDDWEDPERRVFERGAQEISR